MSARRNRGAEDTDIIGSRGKSPAADMGPLFGEPQPKVEVKRDPFMDFAMRGSAAQSAVDKLLPRPVCFQCGKPLEVGQQVNDVTYKGARQTVHRHCTAAFHEWVAQKRARMAPEVALKGESARGSETSAVAAREVDAMVPTLAWLVLQHIRDCGLHGATRDETAQALGKRLSSISARIRELYLMGLIGSNPNHTRTNPETGLENEVMLYETYVDRWKPEQQRPPQRLGQISKKPTRRDERRTTAREREDTQTDGTDSSATHREG